MPSYRSLFTHTDMLAALRSIVDIMRNGEKLPVRIRAARLIIEEASKIHDQAKIVDPALDEARALIQFGKSNSESRRR